MKSNDEWGWKELKARYWGLCTLVDKYVGRILDRLEELGLADDTIVVYTSDHGHMMGEHGLLNKSVLYEPSAQIPFIMRVPGLPPQQLATPVGHVDVVSTLLELLGQPLPDHLQGSSLVPLLRDGDGDRGGRPDDHRVEREPPGRCGGDEGRPRTRRWRRGVVDADRTEIRTIRRGMVEAERPC